HNTESKYKSPASENLFHINPSSEKLEKVDREEFHTTVAQGLFLAKRARPDIQTTIAFLCTRVKEPTKEDWKKLHQMMCYLSATKNEILKISIDDSNEIRWWIDASYAVHPD
ncbi:hypothetical protein, partial [Salmonella enterica]|uniref:hypothetical protein n=1 Tax=Salmonella enterica TaxID=28901 RepID=UPI003524FD5C